VKPIDNTSSDGAKEDEDLEEDGNTTEEESFMPRNLLPSKRPLF
jgi:hypothetical protein